MKYGLVYNTKISYFFASIFKTINVRNVQQCLSVKVEVLTIMTMKVDVLSNVTPCIGMDNELGQPGFDFLHGKNFLFFTEPRPTL
jgi:hypothetical protein